MDKYTYFVIEEKDAATEKMFAYAERVHNCNNLYKHFKPCKGFEIISINACDTWKEAQRIASFWNECARKKGNYVFA